MPIMALGLAQLAPMLAGDPPIVTPTTITFQGNQAGEPG